MKSPFFLLTILFLLFSCGRKNDTRDLESKSENRDTLSLLSGTWTLTDEVFLNGKKIIWADRPTMPQLRFGTNSYFLFADIVTDEKMIKEGIPAIQERYKGQFSFENSKLKLTHYEGESIISEIYVVKKIDADHLELYEEVMGQTLFFKH
jgi:hypothetical protein